MSSKFFEDLSAVTDAKPNIAKNLGTGGSDFDMEPVPALEMLSKYSAFAGKLYKVEGMSVWMSTENGAREIYRQQMEVKDV